MGVNGSQWVKFATYSLNEKFFAIHIVFNHQLVFLIKSLNLFVITATFMKANVDDLVHFSYTINQSPFQTQSWKSFYKVCCG